MIHKFALAAATTLIAIPLVTAPVIAAGGGGGGGTPPPTPVKKCPKGEVLKKNKLTGKKECKKVEAGITTDDELYEAARALAYAEQYDEAIVLLELASNRNDPRILNYLGFSHRNAGRFEVGMGYYQEALKRDPDYVLARSYMGQALLQNGDRVGATVQLVEIEKRAGKDNWPYESLASALATGAVYRH